MANYFNMNGMSMFSPQVNISDRILYGLKEADSQAFYAGELVYYSSGIAAMASDTQNCLGWALADATNVTSGNIEIPVLQIFPEDILYLRGTASGTAKLSSSFLPLTRYSAYVASHYHYIDYDDTGHDMWICEGPHYTAGDADYWVQCRIIRDYAQSVVGW